MVRTSPRPEGHAPPYPPRASDHVETYTRRLNVARYYDEAQPLARFAAKQHVRMEMFSQLVELGVDPDAAELAVEDRIKWIPAPGIKLPGQGYLNAALGVTFPGPDTNH